MSFPDPQRDTLLALVAVLDRLDIEYAVGGSFASGIHGELRTSQDVDVVARVRPFNIALLVRLLAPDFYISQPAVEESVRLSKSFNAIHLRFAEKIDVFCAPDTRWTSYQLRRRVPVMLEGAEGRKVFVTSAEDVVLAKLDWFRRGGEVSDKQWRDVLGVLKLQGDLLLREYMDERAVELGVTDLLARARVEAGLGA